MRNKGKLFFPHKHSIQTPHREGKSKHQMEEFIRAYQRLLEQSQPTIKRSIYNEIDSSARLICIRGTRGIGKTTLLMEYARENYGNDTRSCMYVNLNHFYFATSTLFEFASTFYKNGGKLLILDQIFKYPEWEQELLRCHTELPNLQIIFTASAVMDMQEDYPSLKGIMKVYDLHGFSFREYLNFHHKLNFKPYTLEEITRNHVKIASNILDQIHPIEDFKKYIKVGYYPPFMDATLFGETLVKNMNILLEVDMVYIKQIEPTYLHKLRKLLYLIAIEPKAVANVTLLSQEIGTSRATVMNYLKHLADAQLIRLIYKEGSEYPKKPDRVYLNDTNIAKAMYPYQQPNDMLRKIFLISHFENAGYTINHPEGSGADFIINQEIKLKSSDLPRRKTSTNTINAIENMVFGRDKQIPLWLFGFLY